MALGSLAGSLLVGIGDAGDAFESVDTFLVFFFFRLFKSSCPMEGKKFCLLSSGYWGGSGDSKFAPTITCSVGTRGWTEGPALPILFELELDYESFSTLCSILTKLLIFGAFDDEILIELLLTLLLILFCYIWAADYCKIEMLRSWIDS